MARRRPAYRRPTQNRLSMFLVSAVVLTIMGVVMVGSHDKQQKLDAKKAEEAQLDAEIAAEQKRAEELDEYEKEVQTMGYVEQEARDKLGLVYEDEIMFKKEN